MHYFGKAMIAMESSPTDATSYFNHSTTFTPDSIKITFWTSSTSSSVNGFGCSVYIGEIKKEPRAPATDPHTNSPGYSGELEEEIEQQP